MKKNCSVGQCPKRYKARGYCDMHYQRWKKHGSVELRSRHTVTRDGKRLGTKKWCNRCESYRPFSEFYSVKTTHDGLGIYCITHQLEMSAEHRERRRIEFIMEMGGACCRCGFDDWRALQIDHVHGGGAQEYRTEINTHSKAYRAKVLANPDDYQLLCANCNWIKRYEEGESYQGHKRKVTA